MSTYTTTGIVLRARSHRQNDRLYTIFTERRGKMDLVATSSRKILSKLSPHLAMFSEVKLHVASGKKNDRLAGAELKRLYLKPPYNLNTAILGTAFLEITDVLTSVGAPEPDLLKSLKYYLSQLKELPSEPEEWRQRARTSLGRFIYKILKVTGLAIQVTRCQKCQGELAPPVVFSFREHGFFHKNCVTEEATIFLLTEESLSYLHTLATRQEPPRERSLPAELLGFLVDYVQGQAGRSLYTLKLLRSIL
ncbi:MAG: DNA repair protein RecO [Patescibacteria group bacterium]